ncbi:nucleotide-binding alpha-beta plait domain-containing protein [Tanacetum coccineum]
MAYMCPHFTRNHEELITNTSYPINSIRRVNGQTLEDSERYQPYADALTAIGEPVKDKDLVMLVVSGLREEYNCLKTTITARQSPTAFSEIHALLNDHDCILGKMSALAPSIISSFAVNYAVGSPSMPEARQAQLSDHIPSQCPNHDPSTIRTRPSANFANTHAQSSNAFANWHSDTGANSHVTLDLEAMDNSKAYYGDDALYVGNDKGLPILHIGSSKVYSPQKIPSSTRSPISSPSSVSHLSPTSQTSLESSNGQPSPVSTTSIPTPPPPINRQCSANLRQNPKQRVPYNPFVNHATVLPTTITKPTSFTVANNSPEWRQAMKEEYDALVKMEPGL